jgi:AcrR family transcriptional regulator
MSVSNQCVSILTLRILRAVPKLWNTTIESHRRAVRDATLEATARLVHQHGLTGVSMSSIAAEAGIGRATLYKYFPDVDAILLAWHERQVQEHLTHLQHVRHHVSSGHDPLSAVLTAFALMTHHQQDSELAALLHRGPHLAQAQQQLLTFLTGLITEGAESGELRTDVAPEELAAFCLHALTAASSLKSTEALHRLVRVTLAGLHPPDEGARVQAH